jgi:DNA repair exonuclease SbcCD ATPase subunit
MKESRMLRPFSVVATGLAILLAGAVSTYGQGLGDAAARERQKREAHKAKAPARVYDDQDLPKQEPDKAGQGKDAAPAATAPSGEAASGADDAGSVFAAKKQRIADAESAVQAAQAEVDRIEARVRQLQDMLNPMSPAYIYGSTSSGDMAGAEARAREELSQSEARLAAARQELDAAKQRLEDAQLGRMPSPQS